MDLYFWFLLVGVSGSVIASIPASNMGFRYVSIRFFLSLKPK